MNEEQDKRTLDSLVRHRDSFPLRIAKRLRPGRDSLSGMEFPEITTLVYSMMLKEFAAIDPDSAEHATFPLFLAVPATEIISTRDRRYADGIQTVVRQRLESIGTPPNALCTIAKRWQQDVLVTTPLGPKNENDIKLAQEVSSLLVQESVLKTAFLDLLRDFSCLIMFEAFEAREAPGRLRGLFGHITQYWAENDFSSAYRVTAEDMGLLLLRVRDIHEEMQSTGPRTTNDKRTSAGATESARTEALLPRAEFTLKEIFDLLGGASPSDPTQMLVAAGDLIRALHLDLVVPALQSCLDVVQQNVAANPGGNFGSFEKNKAFVDALRANLDRLGARLECPTCHRPASLLLQQGTTKNGRFHFHHGAPDQRTNHGGKTSLPLLKLIPPEHPSATD